MNRDIEIVQSPASAPLPLDRVEHWVVVAAKDARLPEALDPDGIAESLRGRHGHDDGEGRPLVLDLPGPRLRRSSLNWIDPATPTTMFECLRLARRHAEAHGKDRPESVAIVAVDLDGDAGRRLVEALVLALLADAVELPRFSHRPASPPRLSRIEIFGLDTPLAIDRLRAADAGNALARCLTALPANHLRPAGYRERIAELAGQEGWRMTFLDRTTLEHEGAGAFLAVCRGSPDDGAGIVRLSYRPDGADASSAAGLALVGKGICFDTGGLNLKPARHMHGMHEDMQGSAVALGTLLALSRIGVPFGIDCWLALAVNDIGPGAFRQNEVVEAADGTTIEIVHTDAEGRMVLADTLVLASREAPTLIVDYATLTGTCVQALSTRYSGACTNREALREAIVEAGRRSGERVWPFPLDADFDDAIESRIADVRQCALEGEADQIIAARFLQRFVGDRPWIHLDLSASNHKGGLGHVGTDVTGFGVLFGLSLLLDERILERLRGRRK